MNPNDQDPEKKDKETKLKEQKLASVGYRLGFMLHDNFSIHVLLTFVVNILSSAAVIGIFSSFSPVLEVSNIGGFLVAITFYTLVELILKLWIIRYFWKMIIQSFGLPFYIINIILFFVTSLIVPDFSFKTDPQNIFVYTLGFMLLRLLLTTYIRKTHLFSKGV